MITSAKDSSILQRPQDKGGQTAAGACDAKAFFVSHVGHFTSETTIAPNELLHTTSCNNTGVVYPNGWVRGCEGMTAGNFERFSPRKGRVFFGFPALIARKLSLWSKTELGQYCHGMFYRRFRDCIQQYPLL
ncbi:hypothetical protein [Phyllobacterium myrsinacearum]|uniref:Uncharacterized protein n=1 Tax=Phyllobacterium myrsinacearum TaxID=28101 RepID=A0A839EEG5_9HYPH|nr:hypothetical protein [Phyllobacterium myrsinacearum]MBA8876715.1 hypothetical protein [Phyllobacterium myrsinacearum]